MGLFSTKSSNETSVYQSDDDVLQEGEAQSAIAGKYSAVSTGDGKSYALNSYGQSAITVNDTSEDVVKTALNFADTAFQRLIDANSTAQGDVFDAIESTKNFAKGITDTATETADDRLSKFGTIAFLGLAGLAGLIVFKG